MKKIFLAALFMFLIPLSACAKKPAEIPKQVNELEQFYYAMETFYFPGDKAKDNEKKKLSRQAADALEAVRTYFPNAEHKLVIMESYFYQGICLKLLGDFEKAVEAFYSCFSTQDVPSEAIDGYEAYLMSYKNDAWYALMELRDYLPQEYLNNLDRYKPLP